MRFDPKHAARIAKRLREAGDTPAAALIEQLLEERAKLLGLVPPGARPPSLFPNAGAASSNEGQAVSAARRYRKRPVVIEAMQWDGTVAGAQKIAVEFGLPSGFPDAHIDPDPSRGLEIRTLEGTMRASPGDWIIRGVQGEVYPCKPEIFEQTYEPVRLTAGPAREEQPTHQTGE